MTRFHTQSFILIFAAFLGTALAPAPLSAQRMKLLTPEAGWVLHFNTLYWTNDGGERWTDITPIPPGAVRAGVKVHNVFFLDTEIGWAIGSYAETPVPGIPESVLTPKIIYDVAQTTDSGATWSFVPFTYPQLSGAEQEALAGPGDMFFLDEDYGWMVMGMTGSSNFAPGKLLATTDGGQSWEWVNSPGTVGTLFFTSAQDGWLAGGPGGMHLYATHDGCKSWKEVQLSPPHQVNQTDYHYFEEPPHLTHDGRGFIAVVYAGHEGNGSKLVVYSTTDGGAKWKPTKILVVSWQGSFPVSLIDSALIVPSGSSIKVAHLATTRLSGNLVSHVTISGKGVFALAFADIDHGLALAEEGRLLYTSDGGGTWKGVTPWWMPPKTKVAPIPQSGAPAETRSEVPLSSAQPMISSVVAHTWRRLRCAQLSSTGRRQPDKDGQRFPGRVVFGTLF